MRKLLMASAAILGASGGLAMAQAPTTVQAPATGQTPARAQTPAIVQAPTPAPAPARAHPNQGQSATPYGAGPAANNNNNAWGIANTPSGNAAAGPLSSIYAPNVDAVPAPGTIVIRLNGRVEVDVTANFTSVDRGRNANGTPNGYKLNPVGVSSYFRLYPGVDGLAANGLRYGGAVELRENATSPNAINNYPTAANIGSTTAVTTFGTAASPSANTLGQTMFVRRAFTYLASDKVGIVRFGQTDGVIGLFDNCIFTTECWDAGTGNFNGGEPLQGIGPTGVGGIPYPWLSQAGAEYGNNKIVYLSPQFYGFDLGFQYAPNMGNSFQTTGGGNGFTPALCVQASQNCISNTSGGDATRWLNQVGVGLRFQQTFGAVDFKAYGFYETAGKENLTAQAIGAPAGTVAYQPTTRTGIPSSFRYDNLSFYKAGVAVTALNFTAAADYIGGAVNGQLSMRPTGGAPTNALLTGLSYANGPITAGAEIGIIDTQGDPRLTHVSQRHEYEIAFGGSYKLAPGIQLVGEYMYIARHQGGFDFSQGALGVNAAGGAPGSVTRDVKGQGVLFSTVLTW